MLAYLGNLMEDASNFWETAMASHAISLTNMEADRLKWTDTDTEFVGHMPKGMWIFELAYLGASKIIAWGRCIGVQTAIGL